MTNVCEVILPLNKKGEILKAIFILLCLDWFQVGDHGHWPVSRFSDSVVNENPDQPPDGLDSVSGNFYDRNTVGAGIPNTFGIPMVWVCSVFLWCLIYEWLRKWPPFCSVFL